MTTQFHTAGRTATYMLIEERLTKVENIHLVREEGIRSANLREVTWIACNKWVIIAQVL